MAEKWWQQNERGGKFFINLSIYLVKFCPKWLLDIVVKIVTLFFYLTSKKQRKNIEKYRQNLSNTFGEDILKNTKIWDHFYSFSCAICDKIAIWQKNFDFDKVILKDEEFLKENFINQKRGKIILTSHFGNVEIARIFAKFDKNVKLYILMYSKNMSNFNEAFKKIVGESFEMIEVDELDIATMIKLKNIIESGGSIAIMGDRTSINNKKFVITKFLGQDAKFSSGAFILANLLKTEILTLWCEKIGQNYFIESNLLAQKVELGRDKNVKKYLELYVSQLENHCKKIPTSWYNFFDFWSLDEKIYKN